MSLSGIVTFPRALELKEVARLVPPAPEKVEQRARDAIAGLRASRQGVSLGRLNSRDLVREGQR